MIVVATADFEVYHDVVAELRDRNVTFTTTEPDAELPEETAVVVTGPGERETIEREAIERDATETESAVVVEADPGAPRDAVEAALAHLRGGGGRTVVGIDPGRKPGIALLDGDVVVAAFQVPAADAPAVVRDAVAGAVDPVVRVGDGARREGASIVDALTDVPVELVDETGTTPSLGTGARGMGDVLAAVNIARLAGEPVESREFEPTPGEIQRAKDRSRDVSSDNRAIDTDLARAVARGDIDVETALETHRERDADSESSVENDVADADEATGEDEAE